MSCNDLHKEVDGVETKRPKEPNYRPLDKSAYSKTRLKRPLKNRQNKDLNDKR